MVRVMGFSALVLLSGEEKSQKADVFIPARLRNAEEYQIVLEPSFTERRLNEFAAGREGFDGILCVVVVPGNAVVI